MFSMAVTGLVKSLIAVTVTLNPAAAHGPGSYTIRPGDTLSAIAARAYGSAADWPAIWWANRSHVANPNVIVAGQNRVSNKISGIADPLEQLVVGLEEHIEYIIENQVRVGLFLHEFDVFAGRRRGRIEEEMTKYQKLFVDIMLNGQQQGKFVDLNPLLMVDGFLGMCNWIYRWYPGEKDPGLDAVKKTFTAMLLNGIVKQ